ncbi:hypothetical protein EV127DRAFT_434680 [Xylaria flabelliformis]|nr:hypothetical protein EV127DRAFT_434680 [Xylaria flabelliformis]
MHYFRLWHFCYAVPVCLPLLSKVSRLADYIASSSDFYSAIDRLLRHVDHGQDDRPHKAILHGMIVRSSKSSCRA